MVMMIAWGACAWLSSRRCPSSDQSRPGLENEARWHIVRPATELELRENPDVPTATACVNHRSHANEPGHTKLIDQFLHEKQLTGPF
jgi:hypothetical protein